MNKNEFLKILKESLEMSLEKTAINEQIDYYDKYISDEIKKGKTEKEVIDELGDPRLIAKTIKTVSNNNDVKDSNDNADSNSEANSTYDRKAGGSNTNTRYGNYKRYVDTSGIGCALAGLVMFIIVMFIFRLFSSMIYGLGDLAFSGPIGFMLVLGLLYLLFGGGRRR